MLQRLFLDTFPKDCKWPGTEISTDDLLAEYRPFDWLSVRPDD